MASSFLPLVCRLGVWKFGIFEILRQSSADEPRDLPRPYTSSSISTNFPALQGLLTFSTIGSLIRGLPGLHRLQLWDRRRLTSYISLQRALALPYRHTQQISRWGAGPRC
jgi:hypothetical protein